MIELNLDPDERMLRQFGWIALVGFCTLAFVAWREILIFSFGLGSARPAVAIALAGLGVLASLFSVAWPRGNRPLFVVLSLASFPIGFVVSHVVLGLIFYGVISPVGLAFRVVGRDALSRSLESNRDSYWQDHERTASKDRYFQQY